jgi:excisionase family DNA binding protein
VRAARRQDKRARLAEVPKSPLDDRLLWPSEVAMRLRVDRTTVYRLLKAGKLRGVRVGRRVQVKLSSLEAFLVKNRTRQV